MGDSTDSSIPIAEVSPIGATELRGIYVNAGNQTASAVNIVSVIDLILDRDASTSATTDELLALISNLRDVIVVNTKEILAVNMLLAKLILALLKQGIEVDDKELLNELKKYYGQSTI